MVSKVFITLVLLCWSTVANAGALLQAEYPYSLEKNNIHQVEGGSTMPLYINLTSFDEVKPQEAQIKVTLPKGFAALPNNGWQIDNSLGQQAVTTWQLPSNYGQNFDLLYIKPQEQLQSGQYKIVVEATCKAWQLKQEISFNYVPSDKPMPTQKVANVVVDKSQYNWYIQSVSLPVDAHGNKDDRAAANVIYVRDTTLEGFRNRMTGDGATNWGAVFNHPATFVMLEMRNPQKDVRVLKFKAELIDKYTGKHVPGLMTAGKVVDEEGHGWGGEVGAGSETTAMISLDGKKNQTFILPLYVDYFTVLEGDYSLRITVSGNGQEKIQEVPIAITKKHNTGLMAVGFSFFCALAATALSYRLPRCIKQIGARGAITVALFAALAFVSRSCLSVVAVKRISLITVFF